MGNDGVSDVNLNRGSVVESAIIQYSTKVGVGDEDLESQLSDFMAGIVHLCHQRGVVFESIVARGESNFKAEVGSVG